MGEGKSRLVTRSDFDGLVCAVLSKEMEMTDEIQFVHPKDMQDGTILVSDNDEADQILDEVIAKITSAG